MNVNHGRKQAMNIIANLLTLEGTCATDEEEIGDTSGASPRAGNKVHMDDLRVSGWSAEREQDRWYRRIPGANYQVDFYAQTPNMVDMINAIYIIRALPAKWWPG